MHDAQQHINTLTRRQEIVIEFLPGHTYTATAPSLLAQLRAAAGSSSGGRGGRTIPDSRVPVNTDAVDLWAWVLYDTHTWAHHLGLDRRQYIEPPLAGDDLGEMTLPPTGRLLRAVFAEAITKGRGALAEQVGHRAGSWAGRIEAMFAGTMHVLPLRNYPCGDCGATAVVDDRDGERYRIPAVQAQLLALEGAEHLWPYLTCLACGANGWLPYRTDSYAAHVARTLAPTERIAA